MSSLRLVIPSVLRPASTGEVLSGHLRFALTGTHGYLP
jgi:hypothetical protein